MTEEEINEYLKREAFLRRLVVVMAGFGTPGETVTLFPEILKAQINDADRERLLEIMDEAILSIQQVKELCINLKKSWDKGESKSE